MENALAMWDVPGGGGRRSIIRLAKEVNTFHPERQSTRAEGASVLRALTLLEKWYDRQDEAFITYWLPDGSGAPGFRAVFSRACTGAYGSVLALKTDAGEVFARVPACDRTPLMTSSFKALWIDRQQVSDGSTGAAEPESRGSGAASAPLPQTGSGSRRASPSIFPEDGFERGAGAGSAERKRRKVRDEDAMSDFEDKLATVRNLRTSEGEKAKRDVASCEAEMNTAREDFLAAEADVARAARQDPAVESARAEAERAAVEEYELVKAAAERARESAQEAERAAQRAKAASDTAEKAEAAALEAVNAIKAEHLQRRTEAEAELKRAERRRSAAATRASELKARHERAVKVATDSAVAELKGAERRRSEAAARSSELKAKYERAVKVETDSADALDEAIAVAASWQAVAQRAPSDLREEGGDGEEAGARGAASPAAPTLPAAVRAQGRPGGGPWPLLGAPLPKVARAPVPLAPACGAAVGAAFTGVDAAPSRLLQWGASLPPPPLPRRTDAVPGIPTESPAGSMSQGSSLQFDPAADAPALTDYDSGAAAPGGGAEGTGPADPRLGNSGASP